MYKNKKWKLYCLHILVVFAGTGLYPAEQTSFTVKLRKPTEAEPLTAIQTLEETDSTIRLVYFFYAHENEDSPSYIEKQINGAFGGNQIWLSTLARLDTELYQAVMTRKDTYQSLLGTAQEMDVKDQSELAESEALLKNLCATRLKMTIKKWDGSDMETVVPYTRNGPVFEVKRGIRKKYNYYLNRLDLALESTVLRNDEKIKSHYDIFSSAQWTTTVHGAQLTFGWQQMDGGTYKVSFSYVNPPILFADASYNSDAPITLQMTQMADKISLRMMSIPVDIAETDTQYATLKKSYQRYMDNLLGKGTLPIKNELTEATMPIYNFFKDALGLWGSRSKISFTFAEERLTPLVQDTAVVSMDKPEIKKISWYTLLVTQPSNYFTNAYNRVKAWMVRNKSAVFTALGFGTATTIGALWYATYGKNSPLISNMSPLPQWGAKMPSQR